MMKGTGRGAAQRGNENAAWRDHPQNIPKKTTCAGRHTPQEQEMVPRKKKLKALSAGDFLISATSDEGEGGGLPPILDLQLCS